MADLRYAVRLLRKSPLFSITVIITVALGIGASTAIFSVVNAILVRPLPFAARDRMVWISEGDIDGSAPVGRDLQVWLRENRAFESLEGIASADVTLSGENAARVRALDVTGSLGRIFGLTPIVGRDFTDDDFVSIPPEASGSRAARE